MMFSVLLASMFTIAQLDEQKLVPQSVRPLPGQLDKTPVFNSNSPELVLSEGILLSTFPGENKAHSEAHLDYPLVGRFDLFAHHVAKPPTPDDLRTLYLGVILHNPTQKPVTVKILEAASYLSQPDAPFIELPAQLDNQFGKIYAGPGSRVTDAILRGQRQSQFPKQIVIEPGSSRMLVNLPIPVKDLEPPLNGRSTYMRLWSDSEVYAASLAQFATQTPDGEQPPSLAQWKQLLQQGELVEPRDRAPTPPGASGNIIYGRVAGVSLGSRYQALVTDSDREHLTIPAAGEAFSYPISTVDGGTLGTQQIQSAPMIVRYPDTAYKSHGNYGVHYSLTLPLYNPTQESQTVTIALQTPLKQDKIDGELAFLEPSGPQVFFRGTVKVTYQLQGKRQVRYFHLVQRRGEQGKPLVTLNLPPQTQQPVEIDLIYPPDATPPQVLTVSTQTK